MIHIESLVARTRDNVEIQIVAPDRVDLLFKVSRELDVHDLRTPHETLSFVLSTGLPPVVDLSDVTFIDVRCARELAVRSCSYDPLMLSAPSWQAGASSKFAVTKPGSLTFTGAHPERSHPIGRNRGKSAP